MDERPRAVIVTPNFWIVLDMYHDRRNGYVFEINPLGTQATRRARTSSWCWTPAT